MVEKLKEIKKTIVFIVHSPSYNTKILSNVVSKNLRKKDFNP